MTDGTVSVLCPTVGWSLESSYRTVTGSLVTKAWPVLRRRIEKSGRYGEWLQICQTSRRRQATNGSSPAGGFWTRQPRHLEKVARCEMLQISRLRLVPWLMIGSSVLYSDCGNESRCSIKASSSFTGTATISFSKGLNAVVFHVATPTAHCPHKTVVVQRNLNVA